MEKLTMTSRGNTSSETKTGIYITANPFDAEALIPLVTADILSVADAFIWSANEELDLEELDDVLFRVKLVVFPVTRRFLTEPSHARDVEIKEALSRSIPILPIIAEDGVVELFNAQYENRQFLDRFDDDPTSIGYSQKLKAFLGGMVTTDVSRSRVLEELDTGIFLSYRKKDRAHARELMRRIHDIPCCRDVAIWYDEYLTPGENFNEEIKDAISDCSAFVMAVTPNLVIEDNYVNEHEYPMAHELNKPVVSVECVETDRDKLRSKYEGIPDPISLDDAFVLSLALKNAIGKQINTGNDHNPEHLYYVGLAYLKGIGVELDYPRAVSLITEAAEAEYLPAMRRLAIMYYLGEGVEYSFSKSYNMRMEVARICSEKFDRNNVTPRDYDYSDSLYVLCRMLLESENLDGKKYIFDRMLSVAYTMDEALCDDTSAFSLGLAYKTYGDFLVKAGEPLEAERYYKDAITSLENGYCIEDDHQTFEAFVESCVAISNCRLDNGDFDGAIEQINVAISLIEKMEEDGYPSLLLVAKTYYLLASIHAMRGNIKASIPYYERANATLDKARSTTSPMTAIHEKINAALELAVAYSARRRHGRARGLYSEVIELVDALGDKLHSSWRFHTLLKGVEIKYAAFKLRSAKKDLDRIYARIKNYYGEGNDFGLISFAHGLYAKINTMQMRTAEANAYTVKQLEDVTREAREKGNTASYLTLGRLYDTVSKEFLFYNRRLWKGYAERARSKSLEFLKDDYLQGRLEDEVEECKSVSRVILWVAIVFAVISVPLAFLFNRFDLAGVEAFYVLPFTSMAFAIFYRYGCSIFVKSIRSGFNSAGVIRSTVRARNVFCLVCILLAAVSLTIRVILSVTYGNDSVLFGIPQNVAEEIALIAFSLALQSVSICILADLEINKWRNSIFKYSAKLY